MTNTTLPNNFDAQSNGRASSIPFVDAFMPRDPTTNDIQYDIQKKWLNTATGAFWELESFSMISGIRTANWVLIAQHNLVVESLTGNDGIVVGPTNNNIFVLGDVTNISTTGNAATSTLTINLNGNIANTYVEDVGTATPANHVLNVLGGNSVHTTGSGNTITIQLPNDLPAIQGIIPDAHTAPGTSPVIPNASGDITITGAQVAAGTTANVIRTDSLAANEFTIEIQRSQAVASTTLADNGVAHFDSGFFTVDGNGFTSISTTFYEHLNFTPVLNIGGNPSGITYLQQLGQVTKIGSVAIISIGIILSSKGVNTGALTITGNPLTCGGAFGDNIFLNFNPSSVPAGTFVAFAEILPGQTVLTLLTSSSAGGTVAMTDATIFDNTSFQINGSFFLT